MADYTAVPAELTDALRGISPALEGFATLLEEVLPALSSMVPAIGEVLTAFEAFQPEVLAVVEAIKFLLPVIQKLSTQLGPVFASVASVVQALLTPMLKALQPVLNNLARSLQLLAAIVALLLDPLKPLRDALAGLGNALKAIGKAALDAAKALGHALANAAASLVKWTVSLAGFVADLIRMSVSMQGANALMGLASRALQAFTTSMTAGMSALANVITPFVQAISPGVMFGLNYAMRSLQATIGVALVPVAKVLTGALHQLAGILLPAMQAIGPALGALAQALMTFVKGTFRIFADTLITLTPFLHTLADIANVLVGGLDGLRAVVLAVADTLLDWVKTLFGGKGDTKDFLKAFRDGLHMAIEAILKFTVMLAKTLGFSEFQANLIRELNALAGRRPGELASGAAPAATDAAFRTFEDFAKTMAQAAFTAQGGPGQHADQKSEREWLADLAKSLDEIKDGSVVEAKLNEIKEYIKDIIDSIKNLKKNLVKACNAIIHAFNWTAHFLYESFNIFRFGLVAIATLLGGGIGGLIAHNKIPSIPPPPNDLQDITGED